MLITSKIIYHQCCYLLIVDKVKLRNRTQPSFLVDRSNINCIGIERTVQNCSHATLKSHTLLNPVDPLAIVDCRG